MPKDTVIPWSCPVPSFGDPSKSSLATLGLNPSNREFVDVSGRELEGERRRFHTLKSLGIKSWLDADDFHADMILKSCNDYFHVNPYDGWFKSLDHLLSKSGVSYYGMYANACHLDLIPYATAAKWTQLSRYQRTSLLTAAGDALGMLLRDSTIETLVLNGTSVVDNFEEITGVQLVKRKMPSWSLPRNQSSDVPGYSYTGHISSISGIELTRKICVLGFNHNIQSSFGVTTKVKENIRDWIYSAVKKGSNAT
jgi:hypothetical protein